MKSLLYYCSIGTLLLSCTKIINVDLKNTAPQFVIEAQVTNTSPAIVQISKSVSFSQRNTIVGISGANVSISDNSGRVYNLAEINKGLYSHPNLIGRPGQTYQLKITVEGNSFSAFSTMPPKVNLDSLITEKISVLGKDIWVVVPQYNDPAEFGNYYKFYEKINSTKYPDYWIFDDRILNNGLNKFPLVQQDSIIHKNDKIEVEMQCINKNMYRYFTSLDNVHHGMTTPANPETNIVGGALGYFSAHTSQTKNIIIK